MSEIRERAQWLVNMLREKDEQTCGESLAMWTISSLLAELDRVEGLAGIPTDRIAEPECHKNACQQVIADRDRHIAELESENAWMESLNHTLVLTVQDTRQQAAMECVEIIIKETKPHPLFQGSFCNLVISAIKAHFAIKGE